MDKTDVARVVNEVNEEYDIEYGGFLSNHFVHGIGMGLLRFFGGALTVRYSGSHRSWRKQEPT